VPQHKRASLSAPGETRTLADLVTRYKKEVTPTKRGAEQENYKLGAFLRHKLAATAITSATKSDFLAYRNERLREVAPATVVKELNLWHAIIEFARDEWKLDLPENPASVRHPRGADNKRDRRLVGDEEKRLLGGLSAFWRDATLVLIDTPLRRGELLALRPSMLHRMGTKSAHILLPADLTKGSEGRPVALTKRARDAMARRAKAVDGDGVLFPYVSANAFSTRWKRLREKLGIENLRLHDLRHEANSRLYASRKFEQAEVMTMTGHKSVKMSMRYLQPDGAGLARRLRS
jgi:integrase